MPIAPAVLVLRGLRADAARLLAALSAGGELPCAAAAELAELSVAHVRSAEVHALTTLTTDAAVRAAAQLQELRRAADAVGDALAVLLSAGLDDDARDDARAALLRRVSALAAALPQEAERHGGGWDAAALQCVAPASSLLASALRGVAEQDIPDEWRRSAPRAARAHVTPG